VGGPGLAGFRLDMGKTGARRWIGNADEDIAGRTLDLPARELGLTFQWLITVGTVKFEFICAHTLHPHHAANGRKKYIKNLFILLARKMRM
jgi:hypothetical protein